MSYTANTTIIGTPCKRCDVIFVGTRLFETLVGFDLTELFKSYYTYSNNNAIFLRNEVNAFDTLVNFNAFVGDKWLKPRSADTRCVKRPFITVTVNGHVIINGFYLKTVKTINSFTVSGDPPLFTYAELNTFVECVLFLDT